NGSRQRHSSPSSLASGSSTDETGPPHRIPDSPGLALLPERATFDDGTNGVEAGLSDMLQRMQSGRWKVFSTCTEWFEEFRLYHRKDGRIVKERDDLISASRYALMMKRHARANNGYANWNFTARKVL
ncbi:phage terminase large subunit family protein, partial [Sinorhizobium meliloti]